MNQCDLIESFMDAFRSYENGVALAILSEVTETVLPDHEVADANFRLLLLVARAIKNTGKSNCHSLLRGLDGEAGRLAADRSMLALDVAVTLRDPKEAAYFSPSASALVCEKCRRPGMRALAPEAMALARKILSEKLEAIRAELVPSRIARDLTDVMLDLIEHQIDRKLTSRELLESPE